MSSHQNSFANVATIGIDIGKTTFHLTTCSPTERTCLHSSGRFQSGAQLTALGGCRERKIASGRFSLRFRLHLVF